MRTVIAAVLVLSVCTPSALARKWTDSTGKYTVEAELIDHKDGKVRLKKADGDIIVLSIERLSEADQKLVLAQASTKGETNDRHKWREHAPTDLPFFSFAGDFSGLPAKKDIQKALTDGTDSIERMLSDKMFWLESRGTTYNLWGTLEAFEGNFGTLVVPNAPSNFTKDFAYVKSHYGAPTHTGQFRFEGGKSSSAAHWYGPVCLIVASNDSIQAIGGWPSRIGQRAPEQKNALPTYDWLLKPGKNGIQIHNPKPAAVTIGIRTKDALGAVLGIDGAIPANAKGTFTLPPGKYDLYLVYESDPKALYQGDPFELKTKEEFTGTTTTQVEITLAESGGGTYSVRRVK
jgi:hypothetical protein